MSAASLTIPVRLDLDKALARLDKLEEQAKDTADKLEGGFKRGQAGADSLGDSIMRVTSVGAGFAAVRTLASAIGDQMKEAAEYTEKTAAGFVAVQKGMQGIAALMGKPNTNALTLEETRTGAAANLTPEEWTKFRDAFLAKASNYVGAGASSKMSDVESVKLQQAMAEYGKFHKVEPGQMADFVGGLLAQEKGQTTATKMMAKLGGVSKTLQASSADFAHLLPGMTEQMAQGLSAEEAAPFLAQMPEIAPGQESTYLRAAISQIRKQTIAGKIGENYGVKKGMSANELLTNVVGNLEDRVKKGEDLDEAILGITHEVEAAQTLRGMAGKGRAGLKQWQDILKSTPANEIATDIATNRQTEAGQQMRSEAQFALAETELGAEHAAEQRRKKNAETELINEHAFDLSSMEGLEGWMKGLPTGLSSRQFRINQRAIERAREEGHRAEGNAPNGPMDIMEGGPTGLPRFQESVNAELNMWIKRIAIATEETAKKAGPAPLVAAPGGVNNGPIRH